MTVAGGTKLGPYEVAGTIGAGGMGEVFRAKDTRLGRDVAVKVLPEAFAKDAGALPVNRVIEYAQGIAQGLAAGITRGSCTAI